MCVRNFLMRACDREIERDSTEGEKKVKRSCERNSLAARWNSLPA